MVWFHFTISPMLEKLILKFRQIRLVSLAPKWSGIILHIYLDFRVQAPNSDFQISPILCRKEHVLRMNKDHTNEHNNDIN